MNDGQKAGDPNKISIIFSLLMAVVYFSLGIYILFNPEKFDSFPSIIRYCLAGLFIFYGIYRGGRNFFSKKNKENSDDQDKAGADNSSKLPLILVVSLLFNGCGQENPKTSDTPTSGEIRIACDENYQPVIDSEVHTFNSLYERAKVTADYVPEVEAFQRLLSDSARLIVASRKLNDEERAYFKRIPLTPREIEIATDGIALILHPSAKDSNFSMDQLRDIFSGKVMRWGSDENSGDSIRIVFDNKSSGTARYILENLTYDKKLGPNSFGLKTNPEVIDYVSTHPGTLGVIGVNWISDGDDPSSLAFLKKIKVAGIASEDPMDPEFYQPFQAYLATKKYPLRRTVYIIMREPRTGLGTGFASFVAGDKGQRIILKSGLLPALMPVRIVGFRN